MANPMSKGQLAGKQIPMSEKKLSYDICVRGPVPDDLVNRLSELHAEAILTTQTSISDIQVGSANSGDDKVQNSLPPAPARNSVRNNEKAQE